MNTLRRLFVTAIVALGFSNAWAVDVLTPQQRLDLLPLPPGVTVEKNADFSKDPVLEFSKQNADFAFIDPFMMARRKGQIPPYTGIRFTTDSQPRETFLFFKRFFNTEGKKSSSERTLPFYGTRNFSAFDPITDADVPREKTTENSIYYRISALGEESRQLDIIVFRIGKNDKTTVYVLAWDEKK